MTLTPKQNRAGAHHVVLATFDQASRPEGAERIAEAAPEYS
jgi:hypothetical protein